MSIKKVLITDKVHPLLIDGFRNAGFEVNYQPKLALMETSKIIHEYRGIIVNSKTIMDSDMIDKGVNLEFIGRLGSGLEIIDIPYANNKGIRVINSPEGNKNAVAEHIMGMLLCLYNNINLADQELRHFDWNREQNRGEEINGKTIGIIGFGNTGRSFAEKLTGWNVKVLAYDKYLSGFADDLNHVEETDLQNIFEQSDIISLHLQLTEETKNYINFDFYDKCKDGVIIINSSRGSMIDIEELLIQLELGKVGGACLDVFGNEKPSTFNNKEQKLYNELYQRKNVVLTPHIAGWTDRSLKLIAETLLEKILN